MTLYYAPCIVYGATRFWLPPNVEIDISQGQAVEKVSIPNSDSAVIASIRKNQGAQFTLRVTDHANTGTTARTLLWMLDLWEHLSGKEFKLFIFSDRAWTNCAMESLSTKVGIDPLIRLRDAGITITSAASAWDTSQQLTFSPDYATAYPYAAHVGRPTGSAVDPGEGATPVTEPSQQSFSGKFPGILDTATTAGQEHRFTVGGSVGSAWRIKRVQITAAELLGVATTTVRVSTAAVGGSGTNINATVGASAYFGAVVEADVSVTAGDTIYAFIPSGGDGEHQNVQYHISLEAE